MTTPGPARRLAMRPATTYIPVPLHDPTPREVKSHVVSSFFNDNSSPGSDEAFEISFFLNIDAHFPVISRPSTGHTGIPALTLISRLEMTTFPDVGYLR